MSDAAIIEQAALKVEREAARVVVASSYSEVSVSLYMALKRLDDALVQLAQARRG